MLHPASAAALRDPEWLAHRYDSNHDAFHFRRVPRDIRREVPFLTDMHLGEEAAPLVLSRTASRESVEPAPVHFLFHSAYCASTMLVQAIDQPGIASGLSEPVLLNDMVGWRRRGAAPRDHARVMDDALAMLARPLTAGEAVIIKPSNIFNPLARGALTLRPGAHAILLYAPLRVFLLSVARDYFRQSDLQIAAMGWLAQQRAFATLIAWAPGRIASLDSEALTRDPVRAVAGAMDHYGLTADREVLADHPALARNSKSGAPFAAGERQRDLAAAEAAYGDEINQVLGWAEAVADQAGIPLVLPRALTMP